MVDRSQEIGNDGARVRTDRRPVSLPSLPRGEEISRPEAPFAIDASGDGDHPGDAATGAAVVGAAQNALAGHPDNGRRDLPGFQPQIIAKAGVAQRTVPSNVENRFDAGCDHTNYPARG